ASPVSAFSVDRAVDFGFVDPSVALSGVSDISAQAVRAHLLVLPEHSTAEAPAPLTDLAPGAVAMSASFPVSAAPAANTGLGDVARVRAEGADPAATSMTHVVDFQGVRVVAGVSHPNGVATVERWQAPAFVPALDANADTGSFPDVQSDRLRLTLGSAADPD